MLNDLSDFLLHLPQWILKLLRWLIDAPSMHEMFCEREACFS